MTGALKIVCFALLASSAASFVGCNKAHEPVPTPLTREELLTGHRWKITGQMGSYSPNGVAIITDDFPTMPACEKDDLLIFTSTPTRVFSTDKGQVLCNPDIQTGYGGVWDFDANETVLIYNQGKSYEAKHKIQELTDKQLVLVYEGKITTGPTTSIPFTRTTTFTAF